MSTILRGLNDKQKEAVITTNGPVLIFAGAGSGKTKTVVHRIAYLILEKHVKPEQILAVTFTNKAAGEMKERVKELLFSIARGSVSAPSAMGTFHSICVRILRQYIDTLGYKRHFVIYDESDQKGLVKNAMAAVGADPKTVSPISVLGLISREKNQMHRPGDMDTGENEIGEKVQAIYAEYQRLLSMHNALDFDDILLFTVELFQKYPEILARYQKLWRYIMVDEYQDTNSAQYTFVNLLAQAHHNLCVVGDDWQSIYSWRGANIQNILDFEKDYPEAKVVLLEQNYRSTKKIVELGNHVISGNEHQKPKKLWTANEDGDPARQKEVFDEREEADFVAREVLGIREDRHSERSDAISTELEYVSENGSDPSEDESNPKEGSILSRIMQSKGFQSMRQREENARAKPKFQEKIDTRGIRFADYLILYRTNAQSRVIEEVFLQYGIPYHIVGGIRFYERKEVKDMIAFLSLLVNPSDAISMARIINEPPRGIGSKSWSVLYQHAMKSGTPLLELSSRAGTISGLQERAVHAFEEFAEMIEGITAKIGSKSPSEVIDLLVNESGYKDHLLDGTEEGEYRFENTQELKSVATKFDDARGREGVERFLQEVALFSDLDELADKRTGVTMMTLHNAKGLEYPRVFIVGMEEGLFPHQRSLYDPREMEEERRLCYVGVTRAKKQLYFVHTIQRKMYGSTHLSLPSRFLDDLPEELVEKV